jgi:hypothetical protein
MYNVQQKHNDFHRRIAKHRTELGSFSDDYYGDHVLTLTQYAKWLRTQKYRNKSEAKA